MNPLSHPTLGTTGLPLLAAPDLTQHLPLDHSCMVTALPGTWVRRLPSPPLQPSVWQWQNLLWAWGQALWPQGKDAGLQSVSLVTNSTGQAGLMSLDSIRGSPAHWPCPPSPSSLVAAGNQPLPDCSSWINPSEPQSSWGAGQGALLKPAACVGSSVS